MHSVDIYIYIVYISTCFSPATTSCITIFKGASKSIGIHVQNFMDPPANIPQTNKQHHNIQFIKLWGSFELAIWFFKPCKCLRRSPKICWNHGLMFLSSVTMLGGYYTRIYIYICIGILKYFYTVDTWTGIHDDTWWYLHSSCSKKHANRR